MVTDSVGALFGILLVTSDPDLESGRRGSAWDLVQARLATRRWPIYRRTRNRAHVQVPGTRVAFYVGGRGEMSGMIVATATVEGIDPPSRRLPTGDPLQYITDVPAVVLVLKDITLLPRPVRFRDVVGRLSIKPPGKGNYGTLLQGGSRSLTTADWEVLVGHT